MSYPSSPSLGELLPVWARSPEEKAVELQRAEAELAAYELELVAGFDRPDRPPPAPDPTDDPPPF
ncbi:hypothetical protein [Geodermatophilus sp. SYSU D01176]